MASSAWVATLRSPGTALALLRGTAWVGLGLASALAVSRTGLGTNLFRAINAWPRTTGDWPWALSNLLGEGSLLLVLGAVTVVRRPARMLDLGFAALLLLVTLAGAKELFDLPRPIHVLGDGVRVIGKRLGQGSFPSGHAAVAFLGARVLLEGDTTRSRRILVLGIAALAALARVAVGAHWPQDVLAGAALGWACSGIGLALASGRRLPRLDPAHAKRWSSILALGLLTLALALALRDRADGMLLGRVALVLTGAGILVIQPRRRVSPAPRDGRRGRGSTRPLPVSGLARFRVAAEKATTPGSAGRPSFRPRSRPPPKGPGRGPFDPASSRCYEETWEKPDNTEASQFSGSTTRCRPGPGNPSPSPQPAH